jgi:hypothetical protein
MTPESIESEFTMSTLKLRYNKQDRLFKRFGNLPKWQQELIRDDMETAFANRIAVMEHINRVAKK